MTKLTRAYIHRENEELIARLALPAEGSRPLHFAHAFPQSQPRQLALLLKKNMLTYWRSPFYNTVRFAFTIGLGLIIGAIYWDLGNRRCGLLTRITTITRIITNI